MQKTIYIAACFLLQMSLQALLASQGHPWIGFFMGIGLTNVLANLPGQINKNDASI